MQQKLVLFDLDGTLLTMWPIHERAYEATFKELYNVSGINFREHYEPGSSNGEVVASNLRAHGYSDDFINPKLPEVSKTLAKYYSQMMASDSVTVLPGVRELLKELHERKDVTMGIVTGNITSTALKLLEGAGLIGYFPIVSSTDNGGQREQRLMHAVKLAEKRNKIRYFKGDVFYFDDSYASIPVTRKLGIISMAVATGEASEGRLGLEKPDHIFKDLHDTKKVLDALWTDKNAKRLKV